MKAINEYLLDAIQAYNEQETGRTATLIAMAQSGETGLNGMVILNYNVVLTTAKVDKTAQTTTPTMESVTKAHNHKETQGIYVDFYKLAKTNYWNGYVRHYQDEQAQLKGYNENEIAQYVEMLTARNLYVYISWHDNAESYCAKTNSKAEFYTILKALLKCDRLEKLIISSKGRIFYDEHTIKLTYKRVMAYYS